jgi:hypothetical protein
MTSINGPKASFVAWSIRLHCIILRSLAVEFLCAKNHRHFLYKYATPFVAWLPARWYTPH